METVLTFMFLRLLLIGAVALGVALLIAVIVLVARRTGRLGDARRTVTPLARAVGQRQDAWGTIGRGVARHLDGDGR
ncbi:hypothetical protein [Pseudonocardia sp. DLS-67]